MSDRLLGKDHGPELTAVRRQVSAFANIRSISVSLALTVPLQPARAFFFFFVANLPAAFPFYHINAILFQCPFFSSLSNKINVPLKAESNYCMLLCSLFSNRNLQ